MRAVIPISSVRRSDVQLVGGKGASLGELVTARVVVPPGFVVTTEAYRAFVEYNDLTPLISKLERREGDPIMLGQRIRTVMLKGEMPPDVARELEKAGGSLRGKWLAVRSSATYEDSPEFSFAGVHETFLGVPGDSYVEYVRKVWASNFEDRAITYKLDRGVPPSRVLMAVVVQELVSADAAGVMFTLDPRNGDRSVVVIESSWGLGEAVVSGEVTPDRFVVSKVTGEVIKREVSYYKNHAYLLREGKVEKVEVDNERAAQPSLTDEQILKLADYGVKLEKYFGHAVDVEWAVASGDAYILQSRPETVWSTRKREGTERSGDVIKDIVDTLLTFKLK